MADVLVGFLTSRLRHVDMAGTLSWSSAGRLRTGRSRVHLGPIRFDIRRTQDGTRTLPPHFHILPIPDRTRKLQARCRTPRRSAGLVRTVSQRVRVSAELEALPWPGGPLQSSAAGPPAVGVVAV